jgi:hypothetical protein
MCYHFTVGLLVRKRFGFLSSTVVFASRTKCPSAFWMFSDCSYNTVNLYPSSFEWKYKQAYATTRLHNSCAPDPTILLFDCANGYTAEAALVNPSFLGKA